MQSRHEDDLGRDTSGNPTSIVRQNVAAILAQDLQFRNKNLVPSRPRHLGGCWQNLSQRQESSSASMLYPPIGALGGLWEGRCVLKPAPGLCM